MVKMKRWETLSAVVSLFFFGGGRGHILFSVAIKVAAAAEPPGYDPAIPGELNPWDPEDGKNETVLQEQRSRKERGSCGR